MDEQARLKATGIPKVEAVDPLQTLLGEIIGEGEINVARWRTFAIAALRRGAK